MKIAFFEITHPGARANNQDFYSHLIAKEWSLFVVTDGLGGLPRGEVASTQFCKACITNAEHYAQKMKIYPLEAMTEFIQAAAKWMTEQIVQQYGFLDTQTVFALVWITKKQVITAHIGDARVYRLSETNQWRTPDDTYVQQLFELGTIKEEDFATHPLQNRLLKTVNTAEIPVPKIFIQPPLSSEETLLICSDGFWTQLNDEELISIAQSKNLSMTIEKKIANILSILAATSDNITVQTIRVT